MPWVFWNEDVVWIDRPRSKVAGLEILEHLPQGVFVRRIARARAQLGQVVEAENLIVNLDTDSAEETRLDDRSRRKTYKVRKLGEDFNKRNGRG